MFGAGTTISSIRRCLSLGMPIPVSLTANAITRSAESSVRLAQLAKAAGVKRFLFSSSCIMYGMSEASDVDEDSPLDPRTEYARSKVSAEQTISALAGDGFSPTFLRNGTLYGLSPRMRFDTVFNDLIGTGVTSGKVVVYSDGKPWRPVIHVSDAAPDPAWYWAALGSIGVSATWDATGRDLTLVVPAELDLAVDDVPEVDETSPDEVVWGQGVLADIGVPLHKGGRFTAAMAVHQKVPRRWTAEGFHKAQKTGCRIEDIVMSAGDTGAISQGIGAFASRQAINAGSSTSGPRDVFTRYAERFIAPISAAPTMPRVAAFETR